MACVWALLLLLSSLCVKQSSSIISLGSSLSSATQSIPWRSPSGRFAFGFYSQGGGLSVGVWLDGRGKNDNKVVWTANRDDPPLTSNVTLILNDKGVLLSIAVSGEKKFIANPNNSAVSVFSASMLDSGNFVLYDKDNHTIWESFEHPTDTLLGGQTLLTNHELISSSSENDHSPGRFHLSMQLDGNLVLYPLQSEDSPITAYWSTKTFGMNLSLRLFLSATGLLELINNDDSSIYDTINRSFFPEPTYNDYNESSINNNNSTVFSASLDVDGNFRLYAYLFQRNGGFQTYPLLSALLNSCKVKGFCGFNSYCTFNDNQPYCACLPGTDFIDPLQNNLGCKRNYSEAHCKGGKANIPFYNITSMQGIVWTTGRFYSKELLSKDACSRTCLEDCNCEAAQFENGICRKQKLPLRYLLRETDAQVNSTVLLKVGIISLEADNGTVPSELKPPKVLIKRKNKTVLILLLTFSLVACSCALLTISGVYIYKFRVLRYKRLLELGNLGLTEELTLTLFSYKELKRATNGFKEELGKGSFGAVYKGSLDRGRQLIAVKRLEKLVEEGEKEFQAEMRAIGRAHHKNLVRLLGYCVEDSKRLLVYEYMGNGSLADLLFKSTKPPDWDERTRIALDVARGILYLHDECETPIIHCDIKPQNILMDDLWRAKISDFGLAKLLMGDQTRTFTGVRGTRGYMAPEWQKNTPISVKADIYSYGVVLLETVFCRRNLETNVSKPEEVILSSMVYRCLVEKELDKLMLGEEVDKRSLERMVMVALWCIQDEPALRPSIKTVVMMLEGITDICIPPCPTASFIK
ncbi:G-type lectin S-receptor-like serine/threonine-protein kinase LECRK1 isoform X2 [Gossypium raimondii]|uniref:G-type lectin S-receptor-like serine/threonine-protein kinase LECRK1 isoform X2 n=1 Tax=Gossypium raimondii TaxID=29730 RepID=UPI00227D05BC|nr:G-type lectin S-receptor-like serine/threonine-protein kinase LECRK1 isoform X2 [Gossypium raimondii]